MKQSLLAARFHATIALVMLLATIVICVLAWNSDGLALVGFTLALIATASSMTASFLVSGAHMDTYKKDQARALASQVTPHYCGGMH